MSRQGRTLNRTVLSGSHSVRPGVGETARSARGGGRGEAVAKVDTPGSAGMRYATLTPEHDRGCAAAAPRLLKFHAPEIVFGIDSMVEAAHAALRLGALRPMLVTDPGLIEAGWADEILAPPR